MAPPTTVRPSEVGRRTAARAEIEAVFHDYGEPVRQVVSQRIAHLHAFTDGTLITPVRDSALRQIIEREGGSQD